MLKGPKSTEGSVSRQKLVEMTRQAIAHSKRGTTEQTDEVVRIPATDYHDPERFRREVQGIFKRLPLMLALTAELKQPGDYKSIDACGVPVLITRGDDGEARAFVNSCSHRGSIVVKEGCGHAKRFSCPYHAWTYDNMGKLVAVYAPEDFGEIDRSRHGLTPLPVAERAGLIWVTLNPASTLDIDAFLCGYDEMLAHFGFEDWHVEAQNQVAGPNWKIAYDGYLDLYHLPVLHKDTFGPKMAHQALYHAWGPHQGVTAPHPRLPALEKTPDDQWSDEVLLGGVWTIFPHVSIASFNGGGRSVMISQLFPGDTPLESITLQTYLMQNEPDEEQRKAARKQFDLLDYVVREEDYALGLRQQRALQSGAKSHVLFGRNEGGGQRFHRWVKRLIDIEPDDDDGLAKLFAEARS